MALPWMTKNPKYARYTCGRGTYGTPKVEDFGNLATLEIGSFCSFARDVTILLSGEHHVEWCTTSPLPHYLGGKKLQSRYKPTGTKGDVRIGNDVWVGLGATILGGVTIYDGVVVGARAVVTKDVPPYAIVGGVPAKVLGYRFDAGTIIRLMALQWWDWPDKKIRRFLPLLMSENVQEFLEKAEGEK